MSDTQQPIPGHEPRGVATHGRRIRLLRGSSVYVGRAETGEGHIVFTNNVGVRTSFGLSAAAMDALKTLLNDDMPPQVEWRVICEGTVKVAGPEAPEAKAT